MTHRILKKIRENMEDKNISKNEHKRYTDYINEFGNLNNFIPKDQINISINNETIQFKIIIINGKSVSKYGYLQTYNHLPRIGPDENGYYVRSTEDEVIKYIELYYKIISRKEKLLKLKKI
jgi:S-adenosylmethionine hydrolase